MPFNALITLGMSGTLVRDLSPLLGRKLTRLEADGTKVQDISPLQGMPLKVLDLNQTQVTDIYLSFGTAATSVRVTMASMVNISLVLSSTLKSAFANGDVNLAIQTVNNVSQTL